jgi:hypothetical protein
VCSPEGGIHKCVLLREGPPEGHEAKGVLKPQENVRVLEPPPTCTTTLFCIGSNFWKFYLIIMSFTSGKPVSLMKVFRLFRLEWIVLVFRVWTQ